MDIDDEIADTEEIIALSRANAAQQLEYARTELRLEAKTLANYQTFINSSLSGAESILAQCRAIAAMRDVPPDVATKVIEPLLLCPHEATRSMYLGMLVIEQLVTPTESSSTNAPAPRIDALSTVTETIVRDHHAVGPNDSPTADTANDNDTQPTCSFCGKTAKETPVVAAPVGGICAACTRLAAAVHGIAIAD
jgi:hypothetical protein